MISMLAASTTAAPGAIAVIIPAVLVGNRIAEKLPLRAIRITAAVVFAHSVS